MSKLFYVHIRVQGRKGDKDLTYVRNFVVFFLKAFLIQNDRRKVYLNDTWETIEGLRKEILPLKCREAQMPP